MWFQQRKVDVLETFGLFQFMSYLCMDQSASHRPLFSVFLRYSCSILDTKTARGAFKIEPKNIHLLICN